MLQKFVQCPHARSLDHLVDVLVRNGPFRCYTQNFLHLPDILSNHLELFALHLIVALTLRVVAQLQLRQLVSVLLIHAIGSNHHKESYSAARSLWNFWALKRSWMDLNYSSGRRMANSYLTQVWVFSSEG
jgi:hypothetical protein